MIPSALYRDPVPLNPVLQRDMRVGQLSDFSVAKGLHAVYPAAAEFEHAALEYVIVFVHTGDDSATGKRRVAPIVVLGLHLGENLFIDGTRWDAHYMPAFVRRPRSGPPICPVARPTGRRYASMRPGAAGPTRSVTASSRPTAHQRPRSRA